MCLTAVVTADAQDEAEVRRTSANLIGAGQTRLLDTYISQEHFKGTGATYLNMRAWEKKGRHWSSSLQQEVSFSKTNDRSGNATGLEGGYSLFWGRYYNWRLLENRLHLQAGGLLNANAGFIYDTTTSNNPAQARLSLNLMPTATASYDFTLWKQTFTANYEIDLPLVGIRFSPNYGQSYYELFNRGNYDHNIVPTTMVSAPCFRQLLTLDWQASSRWTIRLGYLGNYQQADVNELKQHIIAHRLMIGIVKKINQ